MKVSINSTTILICIYLYLVLSNAPLFSQKKDYKKGNSKCCTEVIWHDGKIKRRLKILPSLIAEFINDTNQRNNISNSDANAKIVYSKAGVNLWEITHKKMKDTLKKGRIPSNLNGNYSPVFRDSSGQRRALPGNIIVFMEQRWDRKRVNRWAESNKLKIIKRISSHHNAYIIETPPGMASLDISNNLRDARGVASVYPNWWKEVSPR
ncbi:MAG: hypothetical protein SVZ03_10585 [Spirochaetota bacterium]|nr:hypothetical protein [Spirochaetota bacterium]